MREDDAGLYVVLAFDPGGTTGAALIAVPREVMGPPPFARWRIEVPGRADLGLEEARLAWKQEVTDAARFRILDNIEAFDAREFYGDEDDQVDGIVDMIQAWGTGASPLVAEQFILRTFRMDEALLSPVRVTAKLGRAVRRLGIEGKAGREVRRRLILQQPSIALGMITDERLKAMQRGRLFNPTIGKPHARDAVRHALSFLRREKAARGGGKSLELWPWANLLRPRVSRGTE